LLVNAINAELIPVWHSYVRLVNFVITQAACCAYGESKIGSWSVEAKGKGEDKCSYTK
jgi:hypothetical protein